MEKFPKVITSWINAGGAGKTLLLKTLAEYLAAQGFKVGMIDGDNQCVLSESYHVYDSEYSTYNIYTGGPVKFREVGKNLFLVPGHPLMEDLPSRFRAEGVQNVYFILEDWFYENKNEILEFDYIFIDSNPSPNTITLNALAVSHALISPVNADDKTQDAVPKTEAVLEELKESTYDKRRHEARVTCKHFLIANNFDMREALSKNFYQKVNGKKYEITERSWTFEKEPRYVAAIPRKTLLTKSMSGEKIPIFKQLENQKVLNVKGNRRFKQELEDALHNVVVKINDIEL
ncbi:ParA family protein [Lactococcus petauri]|nr:ParA family protein [Lactococcus petauri]